MCTICALTIEFAVDHPQTLSVAVATRQAIDAGLLPEKMPELDMAGSRHQATLQLTAMQKRLEQVLPPSRLMALPEFFVLMIESRTWGYFRPTLAGFDAQATPSSPRVEPDENGERDSIVVVSQAASEEIVAGRLSINQAANSGLVFFDALLSPMVEAAFLSAYPLAEFSEFVCTEVA